MKNSFLNYILTAVFFTILSGSCASGPAPESAKISEVPAIVAEERTAVTAAESAAEPAIETANVNQPARGEISYVPDELGFNGAWSFSDSFYGYIFDGSTVKLFTGESIVSGKFTYTDKTVTFSFPGMEYTMGYSLSLTEINLTKINPNDEIKSGTLHKLRKPVITDVTVSEGNTLAQKIQWLRNNAQSYTTYTLEVTSDETLTGQEFKFSAVEVTVILKGIGVEKTLAISGEAPLITLWWNSSLVLEENITLRGSQSESNKYLILVNEGGSLIVNEGAKVTNNNGGGVGCFGTFTMNGGEISGNTSRAGAGVNLSGAKAAFIMNDGKISGNFGAGVRVSDHAAFTMNSGELSRNDGAGVSSNTSANNSITLHDGKIFGNLIGVSIYGGIFTMYGGEIYGNRSTYPSVGAGVNVTGGAFRLVTGTIYGTNETNAALRNTATNSNVNSRMAALTVDTRGQAERGIFVNGIWQSRAKLTNTSNTIRAVDGIVR